jgi:hypothetical protein
MISIGFDLNGAFHTIWKAAECEMFLPIPLAVCAKKQ